MSDNAQSSQTRVWWDGEEVQFIRWTQRSLVFHWQDPRETAMHMPRGAVLRLMEKGVLRVEGEMPNWPEAPSPPPQERIVISRERMAQPAPVRTEPNTDPQLDNRRSIVARLIRKLGGGDRNAVRAVG